jgi:hypothetical protein
MIQICACWKCCMILGNDLTFASLILKWMIISCDCFNDESLNTGNKQCSIFGSALNLYLWSSKWILVICLIVLMMKFWVAWMPVINIWTCLELTYLIFDWMHYSILDCSNGTFVKAMPSLVTCCWSNQWLREALRIHVIYMTCLNLTIQNYIEL